MGVATTVQKEDVMSMKSIDERACEKARRYPLTGRGASARSERKQLALRIRKPPFDIHAARKFGCERTDKREVVRAAIAAHGA